jgi:hypothetical protein
MKLVTKATLTNLNPEKYISWSSSSVFRQIQISPDPVTPAIDERKVKLIELQRIEVEE